VPSRDTYLLPLPPKLVADHERPLLHSLAGAGLTIRGVITEGFSISCWEGWAGVVRV
jgi:hypothetical protein